MNSIKNSCCNPFDKSEPLYPIIMKDALEEISPLFICSSGFFIRTLNPIELQMELKQDVSALVKNYYDSGLTLFKAQQEMCDNHILGVLSKIFHFWMISHQWSKKRYFPIHKILLHPPAIASYCQLKENIMDAFKISRSRQDVVNKIVYKIWESENSSDDVCHLDPIKTLSYDLVDYYISTNELHYENFESITEHCNTDFDLSQFKFN